MAKPSSSVAGGVFVGLSGVIVAVDDNAPKVFIVRGVEHALASGISSPHEDGDALPFGPFDPSEHDTLEIGLRRWVEEQTPLVPGYVEQLYTFGNKGRYAGQKDESRRTISIGYLALTHQQQTKSASDQVFFGNWYDYFPWEDWRDGNASAASFRDGRPRILHDAIEPGLKRWVNAASSAADKAERRRRANICFGLEGAAWDDEKVLERYELLYEARLIFESIRDKKIKVDYVLVPGRSMLYDHRRILATAMGRLRGKLKYRPVVFELMPPEFTLLSLQKTVEAIAGHNLHKQNFRRLVETSGMVEEVPGKKSVAAGGRPAALFRFRREAVLERPAPGMKIPAA